MPHKDPAAKAAYMKAYKPRWNAEHRKELNAGAKARYHANLDESREYARLAAARRRAADPEPGREVNRRYVERHRDERLAYQVAYRADNREKLAERSRQWREANPDKLRASIQRYAEKNRRKIADKTREWAIAHPENVKDYRLRRTARKLGVMLVVRVAADHCGVCLGPLTDHPFPDPQSTTVGHEPPLSRVERDGWLVVVERPEHWSCNGRKRSRLDCELVA